VKLERSIPGHAARLSGGIGLGYEAGYWEAPALTPLIPMTNTSLFIALAMPLLVLSALAQRLHQEQASLIAAIGWQESTPKTTDLQLKST